MRQTAGSMPASSPSKAARAGLDAAIRGRSVTDSLVDTLG
ncbi:hypothetical protein Pd630_LPD16163 (plasmid) [Rhodococcus opacus PD630]|nr:hypothetical protein Pd630_LPD16163 [Rhodococcus opacus PD630]